MLLYFFFPFYLKHYFLFFLQILKDSDLKKNHWITRKYFVVLFLKSTKAFEAFCSSYRENEMLAIVWLGTDALGA